MGYARVMEHFTIATVAEQSPDFRRVLWTGEHSQLVIMTIPPDGEIGEEVHEGIDQILTFVSGVGEARVGGNKRKVEQGDLVCVPSGTKHNFVNTGPTRWCSTPCTDRRSTPTVPSTVRRTRRTRRRSPGRTNRPS